MGVQVSHLGAHRDSRSVGSIIMDADRKQLCFGLRIWCVQAWGSKPRVRAPIFEPSDSETPGAAPKDSNPKVRRQAVGGSRGLCDKARFRRAYLVFDRLPFHILILRLSWFPSCGSSGGHSSCLAGCLWQGMPRGRREATLPPHTSEPSICRAGVCCYIAVTVVLQFGIHVCSRLATVCASVCVRICVHMNLSSTAGNVVANICIKIGSFSEYNHTYNVH